MIVHHLRISLAEDSPCFITLCVHCGPAVLLKRYNQYSSTLCLSDITHIFLLSLVEPFFSAH